MQAHHRSSPTEGIVVKHRAKCTRPDVRDETKCPCEPRFQAAVWIARDHKRLRRNFPTLAEAKAWRIDALGDLQHGQLRAPTTLTFREAADEWIRRARSGAIGNRSGDPYKPSAIRGYEQALRLRLVPQLGPHKLGDVARADLQRLVGEWKAAKLDPSTIRNTINAARVLYRHADELTHGAHVTDPTVGLRLPAVRGRRDRAASPEEAARLLAALPEADRALWGTAFFAGLRHGELKALRWEDVDLAGGTIAVQASWDQAAGRVDPKSRAGRRRVPIIARLRDLLLEHKILTRRAHGLVFGRTGERPFSSSTVNTRAARAWEAAGLPRIGLHECRHTFASYLIAAGVEGGFKAISEYMGHASITITLDRYGHRLPGSEAQAGADLEAFLARADTGARLAQLDVADELAQLDATSRG